MSYDVKVDLYNFDEYEKNNRYMSHNYIRMEKVEPDHCIVKVEIREMSRGTATVFVHGGLMYSMADCGGNYSENGWQILCDAEQSYELFKKHEARHDIRRGQCHKTGQNCHRDPYQCIR